MVIHKLDGKRHDLYVFINSGSQTGVLQGQIITSIYIMFTLTLHSPRHL